ncbi:prolyl-tRNA synthetase [Candidatus Falkowbacteria bacterium CG_4_9_14_3_um_filter_36_9]|uniref:Proline--tRNA ligase n=1 Tax=Candidatus Falkowbacteria bacterium CG02_land_8_20_14_3_00_36_14 TaxID=1974560 RepID=A0A2M7DQQ5_9BACT|nr:MAG: prolyl-tRNA synthetase [Candidatus Falkowbacteria bacterium CG02_land_8_20_14_3_00_36_14]PIX11454.1 MAG: prolyl-tRNA synthetase [Candidatus Falkowbacteria bacterium CG_4_8_14_3_um_filter_36_11]PJA11069.1 MAG: prolyl-tRNA synthetase [Candidatus Falkowbacteria bacterium CG_4_10_14_0_2_um_filter_36_22]PJB19635.1 MAG: prolyl-tRNA synthetase [Candidatus Falkowbacteria bacterium CG_4_9_14_3_um_filter_36_9]
MRQSQLFTKTAKEPPKDEFSFNAQILIRAGFIDKLFAGVYTILPLGFKVLKKIENIIREEINNIGGQEIYMPALHPIANYKKTGRDKIDVLYYTKLKNGSELVLGQSHEEIIVPLMQKFILSYKDLPKMVYQFQTKFRNELRAKSGILRGREFSMKDLYSFHKNEEDLNEYYKMAQKAYFKIFKRCGLLDLTYLTYASGGTFSKFSHEYQTITEAGEDLIYICDKCEIAINKKIIKEQSACPFCQNKKLREAKAIEVGNIFKLGNRFSHPFGFQYTAEDGSKKDVVMGCYGIGLGRTMGAITEVHHDKNGIIWPEEVAPFVASLLKIKSKNAMPAGRQEKVKNIDKISDKIYTDLQDNGVEVLYDDRDVSVGEKFADADLIGCPYRIVVSAKTLMKNCVEVKRRGSDKEELININEIINKISNY